MSPKPLARGKQAFDVDRAIEDAFAAFKAEQAQELARERAAERLRLAEAARQRELAEAAQKLEQERAAQREGARQRGRGHGMER